MTYNGLLVPNYSSTCKGDHSQPICSFCMWCVHCYDENHENCHGTFVSGRAQVCQCMCWCHGLQWLITVTDDDIEEARKELAVWMN